MANGKRQSALLVEIIIAVLFFSLSATVILDVFSTAYQQTTYAQICDAAMADAQNCAELLYASEDPEALLQAEGFVAESATWERAGAGFSLAVELGREDAGAGELLTARITALRGEEELLSLPVSRYIPEEVAQ